MYHHPYFHRQSLDHQFYVLSSAQGDVNGDHILDHIYLIGQKSPDSPYMNNITLVIQDGQTRLLYSVPLKTNQGYQPRLFLADFTGNRVDNILISIDSGGSGGFGYYYVYSFLYNQARELFNYETFNQYYDYDVIYQDHYKVKVINKTLEVSFIIDLSLRDPAYLSEVYTKDGKLKKPLKGWVSGLNQLYPVDIDGDGVYELYAFQRVIGQYSADSLGSAITPLSWNGETFSAMFDHQYISVLGFPR